MGLPVVMGSKKAYRVVLDGVLVGHEAVAPVDSAPAVGKVISLGRRSPEAYRQTFQRLRLNSIFKADVRVETEVSVSVGGVRQLSLGAPMVLTATLNEPQAVRAHG